MLVWGIHVVVVVVFFIVLFIVNISVHHDHHHWLSFNDFDKIVLCWVYMYIRE